MVSGGFGLAIDSVKQFGLFNEDKVESVVLGIIVIVVLSWLTLTAYTLFREPKLLKHWNYSNLGLLGVIALFGISSFLVVSLFILFILQLQLPDLLPALVLSDESVYSSFFTYAFFNQVYMILILIYLPFPGKTPGNGMVPAVVANTIKFNFSAVFMIIWAGLALFAVRQEEWSVLLFMAWWITGCLFLGTYLRFLIQVIRLLKRLKTDSKFSPAHIQIINTLFLVSTLLAMRSLYNVNLNFIAIGVLAVILFAPIVGPEKTKSWIKRLFPEEVQKGIIALFALMFIITSFFIQGERSWFSLVAGLVLLGGSVLYWLSLKNARDFVKRRKSKMQKKFRR